MSASINVRPDGVGVITLCNAPVISDSQVGLQIPRRRPQGEFRRKSSAKDQGKPENI